jgi:hypothetical protein
MIVNVFDIDEPWVFNWFTSLCKEHEYKFIVKLTIKDSLAIKVSDRLNELSKITNYNFYLSDESDIMVDIPDEEITYIKLKYT